MPSPTPYTRNYSFTDFQAANPSAPLPGIQVDSELENVEQSIGGIVSAINDVRRSDGKLKNGVVTIDSLSPQVAAGVGAGALASAEAAAASELAAAASEAAAASSASAAAGSAATASDALEDTEIAQAQADAARVAAQTARDFAYQWSSAASGVDVDDGVNPVNKSAYHWAQVALDAAAGSVADGSITTAKLANGALSADTTGRAKMADGFVTSAKIADGTIATGDLASDVTDLIGSKVAFLASGAPLPSSNIGPIWHADYAAMMTWQTFSANGAAYDGYASIDIGAPRLDGQSTPRTGWLKRNGGSYSKTTYAPLWNWALHTGRVVSLGSWAAGAYIFADNGDGTFRLPDSRGEFERLWDDGRGVDSGRVFGSLQEDQMQGHRHSLRLNETAINVNSGAASDYLRSTGTVVSVNGATYGVFEPISNGVNGTPRVGNETRPRNVALLGTIKF